MKGPLLLGYVGDAALPKVTEQDARDLTHINIAFGHVGKDGLLSADYVRHTSELARIREANPDIKIVLSIGGWGAGGFSLMCRTSRGRADFAASCAEYADRENLDGIDLDWEYPCDDSAGIDSSPDDLVNFTLLLTELRKSLGDKKIVSIAAGGGADYLKGIETPKVSAVCDYIQIMTYDLRSGFCRTAGHHTAPFPSANDTSGRDTSSAVERFVRAGADAGRIVIGAAMYSRHWKGVPNINNGLFQTAETIGDYGPGYTELCDEYIGKNGWKRYWDDSAKAPYLFNGSELISYDDEYSVEAKCGYIRDRGLLGLMYWEHACDPSRKLLRRMAECLGRRGA